MNSRLCFALCVYGCLAALAAVTLGGNIRLATWILLAGLAVKTLLAAWSRSRP